MKELRVGTRGSQLALAQAGSTRDALARLNPELEVRLVVLKTSGDQQPEIPLSSAGGVGLFTKELEDALRRHEIDAAVHSLKDLPTRLAEGMTLAAVSTREDFRDAWLSVASARVQDLAPGSLVGTGSPRRRAQLKALRPDLKFTEFRGNVDTRLRKLREGQVAGAVLALAGLRRMGMQSEAASIFSEDEMLPAPGQGFLGLECRADDQAAVDALGSFNDPGARDCADAERAFLERLGSGCHAPVAALARILNGELSLRGFTQNRDGRIFRGDLVGKSGEGRVLGFALADRLISEGAEKSL